jgi:hypothetical protein
MIRKAILVLVAGPALLACGGTGSTHAPSEAAAPAPPAAFQADAPPRSTRGQGADPRASELDEGTGTPNSALTRLYHGSLLLEGEEIAVDLTLETRGPAATGTLTSPVGLSAVGNGRLQGNRVRLDLAYGDECPGRLELDGELQIEGPIRGTVQAVDCTGRVTGRIDLTPRSAGSASR